MVIYGLIDPRTSCLRYVGKSVAPRNRFASHLSPEHRDRSHKANWIRQLLKLGLKPTLEVLEEVSANLDDAERFWIASLRAAGAKLLNVNDGGDNLIVFTAEIRERMAASHRGVPLSEHHRAAIGRGGRGIKKPPRVFPPEHRAKLSASIKAAWARRRAIAATQP